MPRCRYCKKFGLFLSVNARGYCKKCDVIVRRETALKEWQKAEEDRKRKEQQRKEQEKANRFLVFRTSICPVSSNDSRLHAAWARFNGKHETEAQITRQLRGRYNTAPIEIDINNYTGTFWGSYQTRVYRTSLSECTCADFNETHLPCKHMYRLFFELNNPSPTVMPLINLPGELRNAFLSLSLEAQNAFLNKAQYMTNNGKTTFVHDDLRPAVDAGLFIVKDAVDYEILLNQMTKDQIILALAKKSINDYRPSWTKVKLVDWVIENQSEFLHKHFKNYIYIELREDEKEWIEGINKLVRDRLYNTVPYSWESAVDRHINPQSTN